MAYKPCSFDRNDYIDYDYEFLNGMISEAQEELTEFGEDADGLAIELAYSRHRIARLEKAICIYTRENIKQEFDDDEKAVFSFECWADFPD